MVPRYYTVNALGHPWLERKASNLKNLNNITAQHT